MAVTKIEVTRSVAGLLARAEEVEDEGTLNEDATVERWGELVRAELAEQFPEADVQVRTRRATAAGLDVAVQGGGDDEERAAREAVTRIVERLAEDEDWIVPEVGG